MIRICYRDRPMINLLCGEGPLSFYAETVGFAFWKVIRTGDAFWDLPDDEAKAILLHETAHIGYWHIEKRIWWVLTLRAFFQHDKFLKMCENQEFEADEYAKNRGHGLALASFLERLPEIKKDGYPTNQDRIARLKNV